jgi:hypothetical protein
MKNKRKERNNIVRFKRIDVRTNPLHMKIAELASVGFSLLCIRDQINRMCKYGIFKQNVSLNQVKSVIYHPESVVRLRHYRAGDSIQAQQMLNTMTETS